MTTYEEEADPAKKLFWENVMTDWKNSTSKKIYLDIQEIKSVLAKKSKIDGWKFLRDLAAKAVGDIDKYTK